MGSNSGTEIYAHDITCREHIEEDDYSDAGSDIHLYVVEGKDWEGDKFQLWLREDEAKNLLVQLGYHLS